MMLLIVPLPLASRTLRPTMRGFGRDAGFPPLRIMTVAGNDARDVRAVAVVVIRQSAAVHEVHELIDALIAVRKQRRRVFVRSSCHAVMPESMTATPTPAPV